MVLLPGCVCCKEPCDINTSFSWGSEASGTPSFDVVFPTGEHCVKIVISQSGGATIVARAYSSVGLFRNGDLLYLGQDSSVTICKKKAQGWDRVGFLFNNTAYTSGTITVTCDDCDCNSFP